MPVCMSVRRKCRLLSYCPLLLFILVFCLTPFHATPTLTSFYNCVQAYQMKMFQPRYVWILIGDYVERWWEAANDTSCTRHELAEAAQGYFTIDSLNSLSDDEISSANIVRSIKT